MDLKIQGEDSTYTYVANEHRQTRTYNGNRSYSKIDTEQNGGEVLRKKGQGVLVIVGTVEETTKGRITTKTPDHLIIIKAKTSEAIPDK